MAVKRKEIDPLDSARKLAEKEMFQFMLNEPFYTVQNLIDLGLESQIPNLIRFAKKVSWVKILNLGGTPVLNYCRK